MDIRITPPEDMIETTVTLPLSKSMSNRALIMTALGAGNITDIEVADCDDTHTMVTALQSPLAGTVDVGAAGTAMRFLTAYYAATEGADVVIDGTARMRKRPIGPLVDALRQCGADIEYAGEEGFPPLRIKGRHLCGGDLEMPADVSSQFISAVLMVAPTFDTPLRLTLTGDIASLPYLDMTIGMMRARGIDTARHRDEVTVLPGKYSAAEQGMIERDWSAASYWYSIAALSAGWITLTGLRSPSLQGDSRVAGIFSKLGVVTTEEDGGTALSASPEIYSRIEEDMTDTPDIVQTVVVACCLTGVPFKLTGVSSLRIKETDRLAALCKECVKLGCVVETERDDTIRWDGKRMPIMQIPEIDTYGDHRMAMAFAPAALYMPGIVIKDCGVVDKSYPGFWNDLRHAGFEISERAETEYQQ